VVGVSLRVFISPQNIAAYYTHGQMRSIIVFGKRGQSLGDIDARLDAWTPRPDFFYEDMPDYVLDVPAIHDLESRATFCGIDSVKQYIDEHVPRLKTRERVKAAAAVQPVAKPVPVVEPAPVAKPVAKPTPVAKPVPVVEPAPVAKPVAKPTPVVEPAPTVEVAKPLKKTKGRPRAPKKI